MGLEGRGKSQLSSRKNTGAIVATLAETTYERKARTTSCMLSLVGLRHVDDKTMRLNDH